jgi:hypothetical protein
MDRGVRRQQLRNAKSAAGRISRRFHRVVGKYTQIRGILTANIKRLEDFVAKVARRERGQQADVKTVAGYNNF